MGEQLGISNLLDELQAIQDLGAGVAAIAKYGLKIDDVPAAVSVLKKYDEFAKAAAELGDAKKEISDLSNDEILQLGAKVLQVISAIKSAYASGKVDF